MCVPRWVARASPTGRIVYLAQNRVFIVVLTRFSRTEQWLDGTRLKYARATEDGSQQLARSDFRRWRVVLDLPLTVYRVRSRSGP